MPSSVPYEIPKRVHRPVSNTTENITAESGSRANISTSANFPFASLSHSANQRDKCGRTTSNQTGGQSDSHAKDLYRRQNNLPSRSSSSIGQTSQDFTAASRASHGGEASFQLRRDGLEKLPEDIDRDKIKGLMSKFKGMKEQSTCFNCLQTQWKDPKNISCPLCSRCHVGIRHTKCVQCGIDVLLHKMAKQTRDLLGRPICFECVELLLRWKKAKRCQHCLQMSAWNGKGSCPRCEYYKKKCGEPEVCEICGCTAAFNKGPQKQAKLDQRRLCFSCTLDYKREKHNKKDEEKKKSTPNRAKQKDSTKNVLEDPLRLVSGDAQYWHEMWQHVNDVLAQARDASDRLKWKMEEDSTLFESKMQQIGKQKIEVSEECNRLSEALNKATLATESIQRDIQIFSVEKGS